MTTKPTTVRLNKTLLADLDRKCTDLGCSRNDFITNAIESALTNSVNNEQERPELETALQTKPKTDVVYPKISFDGGKTWRECKPEKVSEVFNSPKAIVTFL